MLKNSGSVGGRPFLHTANSPVPHTVTLKRGDSLLLAQTYLERRTTAYFQVS